MLVVLQAFSKNNLYASVAQSVEQGTENPCVGGSIPPRGTKFNKAKEAGVAQLAEQLICNQQVAGSIPVTSSKLPIPYQFNIWKGSRVAKGNRL